MGCDFKGRSRYSDCAYSVENEVREWELKLGTFEKTLFDIISRINAKLLTDSRNFPKEELIHFFNLELKESDFKVWLETETFRVNGQKEGNYDPDMIKALFFLLTRSNVTPNSSNQNQDKAKFLYSVLKDDSEDLDCAIDKENPAFIRFLQTCINISTVTLLGNSFINLDAFADQNKAANKTSELFKLRENFPSLLNGVLDEIYIKIPAQQALTFSTLNKIFENDPYVELI
jgi:hypothetical protein